ncbi:asparagine synthase (glutamine-hydrolyzing) [Candidatus Woesearchaeota archaeon]|nr:asparagine synthase (glutamine-hydrolyzing) [Candidatus Woesearchaeota archaeon]
MCGICGFTWEDKKLLKQMADRIRHRGPDDEGYYTDKNISLANRRLSIIDLSKKGKQPIFNEDKSICVVFNGEIYNFQEIKQELEKKRHRFYSNTDTEVIVHSYEEYGEKCLEYFNGMFAFALWDSKKKKLFIARDRHGIKPLYYTLLKDKLIFASEIKSILLNEEVKRIVNYEALHYFLSFRCNSTQETMFKGIYKLPPAHYLTYSNDKLQIKKYWEQKFEPLYKSEDYYAKLILKKLEESVKLQLISDVPLGAYISGGIDSTTVVALMSKLGVKDIKTFTVSFGLGEEYDEAKYARHVADYFGTDHKEITVTPNTAKLLPEMVWHLDEPMADPTCIPVYLLSKEIKKYATVILTGDGGDEQFGGYLQFKFMKLHKKLRVVPKHIREVIPLTVKYVPKGILNIFFKYSRDLGDKGIDRLSKFILTNDDAEAYLYLMGIFNEEEKKEVYSQKSKEFTEKIDIADYFNKKFFSKKYPYMTNVIRLDTEMILVEDMLMKADKSTMAFSVEERVPFLDHNISEISSRIPPDLKLKNFNEKYILKKAVRDLVPKQTIRRKKVNFFVPIDQWFSGEILEISKQMLSKEEIKKQGIFDYRYIDKAWTNYKKSRLFYARQLWSVLCFSIWNKMFIEDNMMEFSEKKAKF